jgi:hypothetical protein
MLETEPKPSLMLGKFLAHDTDTPSPPGEMVKQTCEC